MADPALPLRPQLRGALPELALLLFAAWPLAVLAGCGGIPTAEPGPTIGVATVRPLPSDTLTPTPTQTLTPSVTPVSTPTMTPVFGSEALTQPEPGCELPRIAEQWTLEPAPEAPPEAIAEWGSRSESSVTAEVLVHSPEMNFYLLKMIEPPADYNVILRYTNETLPINQDGRYHFTAHHEVAGKPPAGSALRIDDDLGLLFLGVSVRETEGAERRLLAGGRADVAVRQLPTHCMYAPVDACGYELRAAPVEFTRGDAAITIDADEADLLGREPPYLVTLYTSHYRLWVRDTPCEDRADWILSYRIARAEQ